MKALFLLIALAAPLLAGFDHSHARFTEVLKRHGKGDGFDYTGLDRKAVLSGDLKIRCTDYDWSRHKP
jgi:hypothetical protein